MNFPKIEDFISAQIMDKEKALKRVQQKKELLNRVLTIFKKNLSEKKETIKTDLAKKNWANLKLMAHGIKGSAWTIGAQQLGDVACAMEKAADNKNYPLYNHLFQILQDCIERFLESEELNSLL